MIEKFVEVHHTSNCTIFVEVRLLNGLVVGMESTNYGTGDIIHLDCNLDAAKVGNLSPY